jgi:hypothetical protein
MISTSFADAEAAAATGDIPYPIAAGSIGFCFQNHGISRARQRLIFPPYMETLDAGNFHAIA